MPRSSAPRPGLPPTAGERVDAELARLAEALGLPEARVQAALAGASVTAAELRALAREGGADEVAAAVARALRVEAPRVRAALLEGAPGREGVATGAATAAAGLVAAARGTAEEALGIGLEIVGETVPRLVNQLLAAVAALGIALVALGLLALVNTPLFVQLLAVLAGVALIAAGALLFLLAWRLHEATATLRTLARVARRLRARRAEAEAERGEAEPAGG